jgi:tetratricopeptide (TPR) repeat protein
MGRVTEHGRSDRPRRKPAGRGETTGRSQKHKPPIQRRSDRQSREASNRSRRAATGERPGLTRRENEPPVPEGVDTRSLHPSVRAELRGLPKELAEIVAAHLVVAGRLIDDDPELAYAHAEAARRRAARLPIVREAAAEAAYAAGRYDAALSEFRALRRMTGMHDYLPVMADCERALGRPHNALKLAREADRVGLDPMLRIEMIIVEAGARRDLGQDEEARRILERAVAAARLGGVPPLAVARLRYAYADVLLHAGKDADARRWFAAAAQLDRDQQTDAQQRVDELDGLLIDYDDGDDDQSLPEAPQGRRG